MFRCVGTTLSEEAGKIFDLMGNGMRLYISHDDSSAKLIEGLKKFGENREDVIVDKSLADELINSRVISKLTKEGNNNRLGWEEMGLDGNTADIYACTQ